MEKYEYNIVVSKYDEKTDDYTNSRIIKKINGKSLTNLIDIDIFTASLHDKEELFNIIRRENEDIDYTYDSICIKDSRGKTYTVLYNEKEIVELARTSDPNGKVQRYNPTHARRYIDKTDVVDTKLESFQKIKQLTIDIINSNKMSRIEELSKYSCRKNTLVYLITRCMSSCYDNDNFKQDEINLIISELSVYKTIRSIYVTKQTKRQYTSKSNQIARKKEELLKLRNKVVRQNKPKEIKTIEQNEEEFALRFEKENGMSWEKYNTIMHNIAVDDKEEFLDEEEVRKAYF